METDKEMMEILQKDFSGLNKTNRKNVVEMTKFLVLTQNTIVPGFLEEKSPVDMSVGTEKKGRKYCNFAQRKPTVFFSLGIGGFEFCPKYPKTD